jgi:chromate transport protein ChrA
MAQRQNGRLSELLFGTAWERAALPCTIIVFVMKTLPFLLNMMVFVVLTMLCGKSIEKRNWERSVTYFLLALGTIMYLVKNTPPF